MSTSDAFTKARLLDEQACTKEGKLALNIVGRDLEWQIKVMQKEIKDGFNMSHAYIYNDPEPMITMIPFLQGE